MEIEPLIRELGRDSESRSRELVEQGAKILVASTGGLAPRNRDEFLAGLVEAGRKLVGARPSLAPLFHLLNEIYARACEPGDLMLIRKQIRTAAVDFTHAYSDRVEKVARRGAELFTEAASVVAPGAGDIVAEALEISAREGSLGRVVLGEGRPGLRGRETATRLASLGVEVVLTSDAALASFVREVDLVLLDATAVRAEEAVTPAGAGALAAAAHAAGRPAWILAGVMAILPDAVPWTDADLPGDPSLL